MKRDPTGGRLDLLYATFTVTRSPPWSDPGVSDQRGLRVKLWSGNEPACSGGQSESCSHHQPANKGPHRLVMHEADRCDRPKNLHAECGRFPPRASSLTFDSDSFLTVLTSDACLPLRRAAIIL